MQLPQKKKCDRTTYNGLVICDIDLQMHQYGKQSSLYKKLNQQKDDQRKYMDGGDTKVIDAKGPNKDSSTEMNKER